jgi:hypothetical protein
VGTAQEPGQVRRLSVAEIIRLGTADYVRAHREGGACLNVQSVLAKLSLCRTAALGGRWLECEECQAECGVYNSCGDRHCSQCSGAKRFNFSERASTVFLDGIAYYQVVFTLPSELSQLALGNRREIADLLFESAWKSLKKTIQQQQGYDPAAIMVLHTWNQQLDAHWHVHALVPGAGPLLERCQWKESKAPEGSSHRNGHYLVDAISLREAFRKFALLHLNRLRIAGKLQLPHEGDRGDLNDDGAWEVFTEKLKLKDWVSFIQPPPKNSGGPKELVRYLTRYLTGGPISDSRIVEADQQNVTFMAREGKKTGGERKQVPVTIPTSEFIRRWCLHIQPDQLTKSRYYGGWSNNRLGEYLDRCVRAMEASNVPPRAGATEFNPHEFEPDTLGETSLSDALDSDQLKCPKCGQDSLREVGVKSKPSWRDIFAHGSESCPVWYVESLEKDDREFWDGAFGEGYNDWYLEMLVESAKEKAAAPVSRGYSQPCLPGLSLGSGYGLSCE